MTDADDQQSTGWRWALALAAGLLALRVLLLWLSGLGLAADEAHYWDWSRHLDWSYPTKGPGIAWAIAGATALFGDAPWAIRTVAATSGSLLVLGAFGLTREAARGLRHDTRRRAAKWGAALAAMLPAFQITSLIATIDGPYVACWTGAAWAALVVLRRMEAGRSAIAPAIALGLLLGVGFLFKYTILLLVPGLAITLFVRRREVACPKRAVGTMLAAMSVMLICATPVVMWNQREGWPTVAHLLGHLGAPGGDMPRDANDVKTWTPRWFLEFVGAQLGVAGPALVLMWLGARARVADPLARAWLITAAAPIFLMYMGVSLVTDAEANWPIAGYTSLLCLAAVAMPRALDRHRARVDAWRAIEPPRPKMGLLRRRPEAAWQVARDWTLGFGIGLAALTLTTPALSRLDVRLPGVERLQRSPRLADVVLGAMQRGGVDPARVTIVTGRYDSASRLAHELHTRLGDDAPVITSAASLVGDRKSSYDFWRTTDPRRLGPGAVVFVGGGSERKWTRRFDTGSMPVMALLEEPDAEFGGVYLAPTFRGVREDAQ